MGLRSLARLPQDRLHRYGLAYPAVNLVIAIVRLPFPAAVNDAEDVLKWINAPFEDVGHGFDQVCRSGSREETIQDEVSAFVTSTIKEFCLHFMNAVPWLVQV